MRSFATYVLPTLLTASTVIADCPKEWSDLASDLKEQFVEDGSCTDLARAAIRLAFHDCFPGSCDGSIINAGECTDRDENSQMVDICGTLGGKADEYGVGVADIIQFGAALGLASCSGGPIISFHTGRFDSFTASPLDAMPNADTTAQEMVEMWEAQDFSVTELVALAGAHTIGRQLDGTALDNSINEWDNKFYRDTSSNSAPRSINADKFMAHSELTGEQWRFVGKSQKNFNDAFIPAMEKLSRMGYDKGDLEDCSDVVKSYAHDNAKVRRRVLVKGRKLE